MTPVPNERAEGVEEEVPHDDSIVISGASTLMPGCQNLLEFAEKIYKKETLTQNDKPRWNNVKHPELPQHTGRVDGISRFDAQHFNVHNALARSLDVAGRKLLEHSFQAIFDAGVNPSELWGKRVGVFISSGISESERQVFFTKATNYGILGCNRAMFSNRISYYLNLKGPSITLDASCCGSVVALEAALQAMRSGLCEAAIVGSAAFVLLPQTIIMYKRMVPLSPDGKTKSYDSEADGQLKSEAVNVVFLQKYKDAKRAYAQLCHVKTGFMVDKFGERRGFRQNIDTLTRFLGEFYQEAGIHPNSVEYVDGFGAAIPEVDKVELNAIGEVLCKGRSDPLLVGSVMSNVGYTENASGLCSIMKLIVAYEKGEVAANLNYTSPRKDIPAIRDGRLQIVADNHTFGKKYSAVNSFSVTGLNGHVLLKGSFKPKVPSRYKCDIPYLVLASGRQESAVLKILQDIGSRQIDPEEIALLHNFFKGRVSQNLARGYGIYSTRAKETVVERERVDYYDEVKRPLWFVYSGMGSQWAGMGTDLMSIPTFAAAIQSCHKVLAKKGVDLIGIITTPDKRIFDNILNSFVGIAAIQIGLTDVLKEIGLVPDNIIGHSVGELGCAYADGCFTAEDMILMAYFRGLVSVETKFIRGSMAAVGLGYKQISKMCPPEVEVACRNGPSSCTISGPADAVAEFVTTLTSRGVFAKEVKCSNIAYHSRYIAEAGPKLLKKMSEYLKEPKLRSKRWISTSVPQTNWNKPSALYSSAEYHTNNLLNPVLFEDMLRLVPNNAVLVEIAPHGLLQAILKRSLSPDCKSIPLTSRGDARNVVNVLEAIGKIYMEGFDINLSPLYPKIEFPVSTGTRPTSHMIQWAHAETWSICNYVGLEKKYNAVYKQIISIHDDDYSYLTGHSIEGKNVYPFAAALVSVWDTLAMINNKKRREESVVFQDVWFYTQPQLHDHRSRHVTVQLQRGSGHFEVTYENGVIAKGYIKAVPKASYTVEYHKGASNSMDLTDHEIYALLSERGYQYRDEFRSISSTNISLTQALLKWRSNWVCFLDGLLQLNVLRTSYDAVTQPNFIKHITIDLKKHQLEVLDVDGMNGLLAATYDKLQNITRCGGAAIENIRYTNIPPHSKKSISLTTLKFIPFIQDNIQDTIMTLYVFVKIIAENLNKNKLKIFYVNQQNEDCMLHNIPLMLKNEIEINVTNIRKDGLCDTRLMDEKPDAIFMSNLMLDKDITEILFHYLPPNIFMISHGVDTKNMYASSLYRLHSAAGKGKERVELARWRPTTSTSMTTALTIQSKSDLKHAETVCNNMSQHQKLLIIAPNSLSQDIKTLLQKCREDVNYDNFTVAFMDKNNLEEPELTDLSNLNLIYNVFNHGVWGGEYNIRTVTNSICEDNTALKILHPGDLSSLRWVQSGEICGDVIVTVHYAGLNVNDVIRATGELSVNNDEQGFGMDFSGVSERGERVMGIIKCGAISTRVRAHRELLWPVPKHWTLEDAATVPLAYAHAFYCLAIKSKLYPDMKVLVHGGAGALGQAAIAIALEYKCQVFTTVSDIRKKHFLRKIFPDLKENHIGNSRDETFGDMVMLLTKQTGCDIIISSVQGRLKNITLKCCAADGVTIDTAQLANPENYDYGMFNMTRSRSYKVVDFSSVLSNVNYEEMAKLQMLVSEGIARGHVKPLSRVTYVASEVSRAFKLLASSNHRGRVLLRLRDLPQAEPRIECTPDFCQVIISDNEKFSIQLADRLIQRGAKKVHINCCNSTGYLVYKKYTWEKLDVKIEVSSVKLDEAKNIYGLFNNITKCDKVESVFVSAVGVSEAKKSEMLVNLDLASRKICPYLRSFTVINDDDIGEDVILKRKKCGLTSQMIFLHDVYKFKTEEFDNDKERGVSNVHWRFVLNAIEEVLNSKDAIVHAHISPKPDISLVEEVTRLSGVNIASSDICKIKLEDIGIVNYKAKMICNIAMDKFNITLSEQTLQSMTIHELRGLQEGLVDVQENENGFASYFNIIDKDELSATADFSLMRTLINSETGADELDRDLNYLCIVPGVEGHYQRFEALCETLKVPAVVLQPGIDHSDETVQEIAERMVEVITKKLTVKKHFYLVGYEFGVMIVLEMAAILESRGYTTTIYLLGGTPKDFQEYLEMRLATINGTQWHDALVLHMFSLISKSQSQELAEQLANTFMWEEKVEICLRMLRPYVTYTTEYLRKQIEAAYKKITMMRYWSMKLNPLKSKIVILRAMMPNAISDEELKQYSSADVYNIPINLMKAPQDLRCAAIINRTLSSEILEEFNNKNQCEISVIDDAVIKLDDDDN